MKLSFQIACILGVLTFQPLGCSKMESIDTHFRLHLFNQPHSLDPARSRSSNGSYFFHNIMRGLYRYDEEQGLVPEGGHCLWASPLALKCQLLDSHKWSNGMRVTSADYLRAFQNLLTPKVASPRAHLLETVKNAEKVLAGHLDPKHLGVIANDPYAFTINLERPDSDFILKTTSTALLPRHETHGASIDTYKTHVTTGPYTFSKWKKGQWLQLKKNPFYSLGNPNRPPVRFYFVDNDLTALRLYKKGEIDFLRRVVVRQIPSLRNRKDFFQFPVARFDYIGFGPRLRLKKEIRKALALGIDYSESQKILHALGPLGCTCLPSSWVPREPCHVFSKEKALIALPTKAQRPKNLTFAFSRLGGEDLALQAEWIQNQWKNNLGVSVALAPQEQGAYLRLLSKSPPDIFRKGVGLDFPSCLAALQTFSKKSRRNYIHFKNSKYERILKEMQSQTGRPQKRDLCLKGIQILISEYAIIPMGKIHFSMLASPKFSGWKVNSLNQLDLSQLHRRE